MRILSGKGYDPAHQLLYTGSVINCQPWPEEAQSGILEHRKNAFVHASELMYCRHDRILLSGFGQSHRHGWQPFEIQHAPPCPGPVGMPMAAPDMWAWSRALTGADSPGCLAQPRSDFFPDHMDEGRCGR